MNKIDMKKLFTKQECSDMIKNAEKENKWTRYEMLNTHSYFTCALLLNENQILRIRKYCKDYLNLDVENISLGILKYLPKDFFTRHKDKNDDLEFNFDFIYNVNMRLNDDYEGGDFYLNDKLFNQEVGVVYNYTSDTYHEVTKVTSGIRYSALFYIRERDLKRSQSLL